MIRDLTCRAAWLVLLAFTSAGCLTTRMGLISRAPASNPMSIRAQSEDVLWERTVDVLHDYHFTIERENRVARVIETAPRVGSNVLEPWNRDSVGLSNRLESTLQSIRRRVVVTFIPADGPGGFLVDVQAIKEKQDSYGQSTLTAGGATFLESDPLTINLDPVLGTSVTPGFVALGRDAALEQALLRSLSIAYGR